MMMDGARHEPRNHQAEVWCADRTWRPCTLLAWSSSPAGWAALLRLADGREGWYVYASNVIRQADLGLRIRHASSRGVRLLTSSSDSVRSSLEEG